VQQILRNTGVSDRRTDRIPLSISRVRLVTGEKLAQLGPIVLFPLNEPARWRPEVARRLPRRRCSTCSRRRRQDQTTRPAARRKSSWFAGTAMSEWTSRRRRSSQRPTWRPTRPTVSQDGGGSRDFRRKYRRAAVRRRRRRTRRSRKRQTKPVTNEYIWTLTDAVGQWRRSVKTCRGSGSVTSSHQTVSDYTLRHDFQTLKQL